MQTKRGSALEVTLNIGSGFVLSMLVWEFVVAPIWGLSWELSDNFMVTTIFTVISIVRSYYWRRLFNNVETRNE